MANCSLCHQRPPRRNCPALGEAICARCCGEERERTISCRFDCPHLLEAREREPMYALPRKYPNQDLDTSEPFLRSHELLLLTLVGMVFMSAEDAMAVDLELREALGALIDQRRGKPEPVLSQAASTLTVMFETRLAEFSQRALAEGQAFTDQEVLRLLAFLQREEMQYNNQRPKSRAYVDWLRAWVTAMVNQTTEAGN